MRYIQKRLTCVNRGAESESIAAMDKVQARYLDKMTARGWKLAPDQITEGNSFLKWERYITICK